MNPYYTVPSPSEPPSGEEPVLQTADSEAPEATRRHFSGVGRAYLILTTAYMGVAYVAQLVALLCARELFDLWWFSWAVSLLPLYGVGLPLLWLCLRRTATAPHNSLYHTRDTEAEKPPLGVKGWLILLIISFACMTMGGMVGNTIMSVLSELTGHDYAFALNSMVNTTPVWFTLICTCICAPFGEELLFRKLLIDRTRRYGDWVSILLSGLLFGLFHGNLFQFFYAAMVGMVLAYVYTRTGRYLPCVALHAVINFMGSIVTPALSRMVTDGFAALGEGATEEMVEEVVLSTDFIMAIGATLLLLIWQYGMLAGGLALFCIHIRNRKLSRGTSISDRPVAAALQNPGMIACMAVMLVLVVLNLIPG